MTKYKALFILTQTISQNQGVTPYFNPSLQSFSKSKILSHFLLNNNKLLNGKDILAWNDTINATLNAYRGHEK